MSRVVTTAVVGADGVAAALEPWDGLIRERVLGAGGAGFDVDVGPVSSYRRTVAVEQAGDGRWSVTQVVDYRLALPFVGFLYALPVRSQLRHVPLRRGRPPWWAPPEALDATAARALCALAVISMAAGYLGTLITQTMAFAGAEFRVGTAGQSTALALGRVDIAIAIAVAAVADRLGRRRILVGVTVAAVGLSAAAALAPSLSVLVLVQVPARGLTAGAVIVVSILAIEVVPSRCRAYALSMLFLIGAFGAGQCVMSLPLADLGLRGWRLSYVLPLLYVPLILRAARHLPESRRFQTRNAAVRLTGHGRRLLLLGTAGFLIQMFATPAGQLQNTFLRDERGFSASRIALFTLFTSTPGGIGVIIGGRLADVRGRRLVGAVSVIGGTLFTAAQFVSRGWSLWAWSTMGSVVAAAGVPALAVYGPELFPTGVRGKANGILSAAARAGAVTGLLLAGVLSGAVGQLGRSLFILSAGPLAVAVLILVAYPETAGVELERLNPEDDADPPLGGSASTT
jgi:MFS family permease